MDTKPIPIYKRLLSNQRWSTENIKMANWLKRRTHPEVTAPVVGVNPSLKSTVEKSPETKGLEEYSKEQTIKSESDKDKVDELVRKSNRSIITISSLFPWNIFPNTIDVEESRVTFIFRQFMTSQTHSVDIDDISNVFIESGFLFATLQVVSRTYVQNDIKVNYLNKSQAVKVKSVIEGLRTFTQNKIDTSNYEVSELVDKLQELQVAQ